MTGDVLSWDDHPPTLDHIKYLFEQTLFAR